MMILVQELGGYPAARNRRSDGAGRRSEEIIVILLDGYVSGAGEACLYPGKNGLSGYGLTSYNGAGGAYYSYVSRVDFPQRGVDSWFGLGACWCDERYAATAGSGGTAGQGGIIKYSSTSLIYAYNGNRITEDDFDYSKTYYDYDKDGNYLDGTNEEETKIAEVIEFKNESNKKIIPARIFIQDGTRRAVYDNFRYMSDERKNLYNVNLPDNQLVIKDVSSSGLVKLVEIIKEKNDMPYSRQGIGSGAGYIEVSNGTFELIENT